ncbi:MAG: ATP-binding protein [Pirellulales bacterium]
MSENNDWLWTLAETIPSESEQGQRIMKLLLSKLEEHEWPMADTFGVHLSTEEALVNAIKHGNGLDPDKNVQVELNLGAKRVSIRITDEGDGFDSDHLPDPTLEENLDVPSGRGVMLMRSYMTAVEYNENGNSVFMEKVLD